MNRGIRHALALGWVKVVVDSRQHDIMRDECAFVYSDASLILELAAHVDEHMFTDNSVLAAIGDSRWNIMWTSPPPMTGRPDAM